jgi:hypothetical protein
VAGTSRRTRRCGARREESVVGATVDLSVAFSRDWGCQHWTLVGVDWLGPPKVARVGASNGSLMSLRSQLRRWFIAFLAIYVVIRCAPFPLGFPGTEFISQWIEEQKRVIAGAVAAGLHLAIPSETRNSSDTLFAYIECAIALIVAAIVGLALSFRPFDAQRSTDLIRTYLRYFVAATMLGYGWVKVFKSQFPALQPSDLLVTYGESSPMGLLWRMMSYSTGYTVFTGMVEVVGALCLLFRRTTLAGALILTVALVQVVALNFAFDVPVKLGSMHLLFYTLVLVMPDARRLVACVLGSPTVSRREARFVVPSSALARRALEGAKWVATASILGLTVYEAVVAYRTWGDGAPAHPLQGVYEAREVEVEGEAVGAEPWWRVTIDRRGFVIFGARGGRRGFVADYNESGETLTVSASDTRLTSTATQRNPAEISLSGTFQGHPAKVKLTRVPPEKIVLTSRRFRWVSNVNYFL